MLHRHSAHAQAVARITWCIGERALGGDRRRGRRGQDRRCLSWTTPATLTRQDLSEPLLDINRGIKLAVRYEATADRSHQRVALATAFTKIGGAAVPDADRRVWRLIAAGGVVCARDVPPVAGDGRGGPRCRRPSARMGNIVTVAAVANTEKWDRLCLAESTRSACLGLVHMSSWAATPGARRCGLASRMPRRLSLQASCSRLHSRAACR